MAISDQNVISNNFWVNIGAEQVYNSTQERKNSIDLLQKTIVWIFGITSSLSFIAVIFGKKEDWSKAALCLFGFAFLFLILAYLLSTIASFAQPKNFFANAPLSVQTAFLAAIKRGNKLFNAAVIVCSAGTFLYTIALLTLFIYPSTLKKTEEIKSLTPADDLSLKVTRFDELNNSYGLEILSKANSWNSLMLIRKIEKKNILDSIQFSQLTNQKVIWFFVDSTGKERLTIEKINHYEEKIYFQLNRTDTIEKGKSYKNFQIIYFLAK